MDNRAEAVIHGALKLHIHTLYCEMLVRRPLPDVFAFFEDPYNLIRITPHWLNLRVTNPEKVTMRQGAEICYRMQWAGLPMSWKTRITGYEPPLLFTDEQIEGPYRLWRHTHRFEPHAEGVLVTDHVDYQLPFGWLGRVTHSIAIGRQLKGIFQYRQVALTQMLGGAASDFKQPVIETAYMLVR